MNNLLRNKIGGDKVISVYWFVIIVIVAGGIFAMVYNFYGAPYDVRGIESDILANKVADCISSQGRLNDNLFNSSNGNFTLEFENDFFEICNLNFETENENGWNDVGQFFVEGIFYDISGQKVFAFRKGNENLREDCFIEESKRKDYSKLAKCSEKRFYSVGAFDNKQYLVEVLVSINKAEENVKI